MMVPQHVLCSEEEPTNPDMWTHLVANSTLPNPACMDSDEPAEANFESKLDDAESLKLTSFKDSGACLVP